MQYNRFTIKPMNYNFWVQVYFFVRLQCKLKQRRLPFFKREPSLLFYISFGPGYFFKSHRLFPTRVQGRALARGDPRGDEESPLGRLKGIIYTAKQPPCC